MTYKKKICFKGLEHVISSGLLIMSCIIHDVFAKMTLASLRPLMTAANILNTRSHAAKTSCIKADSFLIGA